MNARSYFITEMLPAIVRAVMTDIGAAYILFKEDYEPLNDLPPIRSDSKKSSEGPATKNLIALLRS